MTFICAAYGEPFVVAPSLPIVGWLLWLEVVSHGVLLSAVAAAGVVAFAFAAVVALFVKIGERIVLPKFFRLSVIATLGVMLAAEGLIYGRVLIGSPTTIMTTGNFDDPFCRITVLGVIFIFILATKKSAAALFWGVCFTVFYAWLGGFVALPQQIFAMPEENIFRYFLQLDFAGALAVPEIILTLFLVIIIGNVGLFEALGNKSPKRGFLFSLFVGGIVPLVFGGMPMMLAPESAIVAQGNGGRKAVWAAALSFLLFVFFVPLLGAAADFSATVAPTLIAAGCLLLRRIEFAEFDKIGKSEFFSAATMLIIAPLSHDLTYGVGAAAFVYALLNIFSDGRKKANMGIGVMAVMFIFLVIMGSYLRY